MVNIWNSTVPMEPWRGWTGPPPWGTDATRSDDPQMSQDFTTSQGIALSEELSLNSSVLSGPYQRGAVLRWCTACLNFCEEELHGTDALLYQSFLQRLPNIYNQVVIQARAHVNEGDYDAEFFSFLSKPTTERSLKTLVMWIRDAHDPDHMPHTQLFAGQVAKAVSKQLSEAIGSSAMLYASEHFVKPFHPGDTTTSTLGGSSCDSTDSLAAALEEATRSLQLSEIAPPEALEATRSLQQSEIVSL